LDLHDAPALTEVLEGVSVGRGKFCGPAFGPTTFGPVTDKCFEAVQAKFGKRYECPYPIDLLVYYQDTKSITYQWSQAEVRKLVCEKLGASPFERVWIFDVRSQRILEELPSPGPDAD